MNDEQLRRRLADADPARRLPTHTSTSDHARTLLEAIMNTPAPASKPVPSWRRGRWLLAAAAVVAVVIGAAVMIGGDDDDLQSAEPPASAPPPTASPATTTTPVTSQATAATTGKLTVVELSTGVDDLLASCAVLDASILSTAPQAFKGTVTTADAGVVQLVVDEAYIGIDAGAVTLSAPEGMEALIGGVAWEVGQQYLIAAYDGVVSYCGMSGPATPELQAIYDQAFGG